MLVGAGLILTVLILFRNPILSRILVFELERMTGAEVEIGRTRFQGFTRVRIDSIDIRTPAWKGPAGDVIHVENLVADLLPSTLIGFGFGFDRIDVDFARIRIAERSDDPTDINVASLGPEEDGDDAEAANRDVSIILKGIGSIVIDRLEVETGVVDRDQWRLDNVSTFQARIDARPSPAATHTFVLASVDEQDSFDIASGTMDSRTGGFTLRTDEVELRRGASLALSASARAVVSAMDIDGTLRTATVNWTPGGIPTARLEIDGLAFSPPSINALQSEWVRFGEGQILEEIPPLPRIELEQGSIVLRGDVLEIDGEGGRLTREDEPESLPDFGLAASFRIELSNLVADLGDANLTEWGDALLDTAPFSLEVVLDRFVRRESASKVPVDLPRVVASALELLTARSWDLTATAFIRRDAASSSSGSVPGDIQAGAVLDILDGVGMYENFQYLLRDVKAQLVVDNDLIGIKQLVAKGPDGDRVILEGTIDGTSDDAGVDLRLRSEAIRIDENLLAALPDTTQRGLRTLFDAEATRRLESAGLLPGIPSPDSREVQTNMDADSPGPSRLAGQRAFTIGGRGSIDLRIHRPRILGHPVAVEGTIGLESVGGIFSRFPYPLIVDRGEIILQDLAVILASPGLEVTTTRGGRGTITGRVDLPRDGEGGRDVFPTLEIRIEEDQLSPTLLAAVPPDVEGQPSPQSIPGWPGRVYAEAVLPLMEMGLSGSLDYVVRIDTEEDGEVGFEVTGELFDGQARPGSRKIPPNGDSSLAWPRGFNLTEVNANLRIDDEGLELEGFTATRNGGEIRGRGHYDFTTERGRGIARLRDIDVDEYLLELLPDEMVPEGRRLWARWDPTGRFNADLEWSRRESQTSLQVAAEPLWAEFDTTTARSRLEGERGVIRFHDGWIEADGLALRVGTPDRSDTALRLQGDFGFESDATSRRLSGVLDTATFDTPTLEEILRLAAGEQLADLWIDRSPMGRFDGRFDLTSDGNGGVDLDLEIVPDSFSLLSRVGEESSRGGGTVVGDGRIALQAGRLEIGPVELHAESGAVTRFEAVVDDLDQPEIAGRFGLSLPNHEVPESGFSPPPFSSLLNLESVSGRNIEIEGSIHAVYWRPDDAPVAQDPELPRLYRSTGVVDFSEVTWDLDGSPIVLTPGPEGLHLSLSATDGVPTDFELDGDIPLLRVAGRPIAGVKLHGDLDSETSSSSPAFRISGEYGTIGSGDLRFDIEFEPSTARYRFAAQLADVDLDALEESEPRSGSDPGIQVDRRTPGRVFASMGIEGHYDDPESRVGRGRIAVREASFTEDGTIALLQLGQLLPPIRDELAMAWTDVWIDGSEIALDPIVLESETLTLEGLGKLRLDDWRWSLRLRPSGKVPGWSDLISAISGTMAAIDVGGTPADPVVEIVPLPILVPAEGLPEAAPSSAVIPSGVNVPENES